VNRLNIEVSWTTLWRVLILIGLVSIVYFAKNAVIVLLLAIFLSSALDALVIRLESWRVPRLLGTILVFLGFLSVMAVLIYTIVPIAILELRGIFNNLDGVFGDILELGIPPQVSDFINNNLESISNMLFAGGASFFEIVGRLLGGITSFIAVLVTAFYLTLSRDGVGRFLRAIFPEDLEDNVLSVYYRSKKKIGRWFQAQLILSLIIGFLVFIGLWVLGVKYSLILAIFAAVFEIVPIVGPVFAGGLAVTVGLSQSFSMGMYVLILFLVIQQLENHILVPLVMKKAVDIHPVIILISILGGLEIAGFVGMILAVPAAVIAGEIVEDWVARKEMGRKHLKI
jgi:predicted PurR-regulated permease PerM